MRAFDPRTSSRSGTTSATHASPGDKNYLFAKYVPPTIAKGRVFLAAGTPPPRAEECSCTATSAASSGSLPAALPTPSGIGSTTIFRRSRSRRPGPSCTDAQQRVDLQYNRTRCEGRISATGGPC